MFGRYGTDGGAGGRPLSRVRRTAAVLQQPVILESTRDEFPALLGQREENPVLSANHREGFVQFSRSVARSRRSARNASAASSEQFSVSNGKARHFGRKGNIQKTKGGASLASASMWTATGARSFRATGPVSTRSAGAVFKLVCVCPPMRLLPEESKEGEYCFLSRCCFKLHA